MNISKPSPTNLKWLSLVIVVILMSCKNEEEPLRITGFVEESNDFFNEGVSGAEVKLEYNELTGGTFNTNFTQLANTTSGAGGAFSFEFERVNTVDYRISASKNNYFPTEVLINPDNVNPGNTHEVDLNMNSKACIEYRLVNTDPEDETDKITFQFLNTNFNCNCCVSDEIELIGTAVDSTAQCVLYGNYWLKYLYTIDKSSSFVTGVDSVYCTRFDTTYLEISY